MRNLIISVATSAILASNSFALECTGIDSLFPMDEITANQVFDLNKTSANVNGNLEIANGKVKGAIKFDGKSYLSVSDSNFSNFSDNFSMVAFIKTDAKSMMQSIIDKREGNKGYHLFLNSPATSEATLALEINGVNFGNPNTKTLNDNKWHCVAVSVNRGANNGGIFYIDGEAVHTFDPTVVNSDSSNNANLLIGATTPNHMFNSKFKGNLDEVAFASNVLTPEEVNCLCSRNEMNEDENDLPLIPLVEENSLTINHQFEQNNPALTAILDLSANTTIDIDKNSLIPLTITTVNVKDVNLSASDKSVYFKQDGDIVYVSFSRSGEYNVTLQGFDNSGNYLSDNVTFNTKSNSAPTSTESEFNINSNEVLKFDGNTYFGDLDGDFLTYTLEGESPKGSLQINDNLIIFTPDKETYVTSFSLKATDPDGESSIATFNVNITFSSEIELLRGWNLIGNSIADKAINTSAILETDEVIYTLTDSGFWEMSDLNYNSKYIKPKEGVWIKVVDDRKLVINQIDNALMDSEQKQIINGWNLLAHTKEVPLRELKFGYDQIFVYDKPNNSWLNSTTNPNYILPTFKGFWGRAVDVTIPPQNENNLTMGTPFDTNATLPDGLYTSTSQIIGNYVYLFGGHSTNGITNSIYKAPISEPTNWVNTNKTLPSNLTNSTSQIIGDYIYLFGGVSSSPTNVIYRAPISDPINWEDTNKTLPNNLYSPSSLIVGDYIYLFGGSNSSGEVKTIYRAPISDPTNWENTNKTLPDNLYSSTLEVIGDYIYLFGGGSNKVLDVIYRAPISEPTNWSDTNETIFNSLYGLTSEIVGDYVYIFGGREGADKNWIVTNKIYKAPISEPTNWEEINVTLPTGLGYSTSQIINNNIYLFGGYDGSGAIDKIIQIPFSTLNTQTPTITNNTDPFNDGSQIAFYEFEGNANDSMGNYNGNAIDVNYTNGQVGQAGYFNGSSAWISATNPLDFATDFSVSFWGYLNMNASTHTSYIYIGDGTNFIWLGYDSNLYFIENNERYYFDSTQPQNKEIWEHFVITRKNNIITIYRNNISLTLPTSSMTGQDSIYNGVMIGTRQYNSNIPALDYLLNGLMDQVRIFDKALTPEEVQALYNLEK